MDFFAHETAIIDEGAKIGAGTKIWCFAHISRGAVVGRECNIGQNVFIDNRAIVGSFCKIQNNVNIYAGVTLEDYVFCGPSMTFTNVKIPRAKYPRDRNGEFYLKTLVKEGASFGAHSTVVCGVTVGRNALIGSGAVITKDVLDHALMVGNPAVRVGWACECGKRLEEEADICSCPLCGKHYRIGNHGLSLVE